MLTFLISFLILALVLYVVYWAIGQFGAPAPMQQVVGVILVLILLLYALRGLGLISL